MARNPIDKNSRQYLNRQMQGARGTTILICLFTMINLFLLVSNRDVYYLFSASVPYYLTMIALFMDNGLFTEGIIPDRFEVGNFTTIALAISAVLLIVYLVCWIISKKKPIGLTTALVFFCIDTAALVAAVMFLELGFVENILDFVCHAVVIWELAVGVSAAAKQKKLPSEQEVVPAEPARSTASPEF